MWQFNISANDVEKICSDVTTRNPLYQIWKAWSLINYEYPEPEDIPSQIIWGNSCIKRANVPFMMKKAINSNLDYLYQLINLEKPNSLLSYDELTECYGPILTILEYNSLLAAIPPAWRNILKYGDQTTQEKTKFERLEETKNRTRYFYSSLVMLKKSPQAVKEIWERDLGIHISSEEWSIMWIGIFKSTNSVKLRDFQYRILNRILTTNLSRSKYSEISPNCTFCQDNCETIRHLMFECKESSQLWQALRKWLKYAVKVDLTLTLPLVILNNYRGKNAKIVNTLILIMKRYIYVSKCKNEQLRFPNFIEQANYVQKIEKINATRKDKIYVHEKKWLPYLQFITKS